MKWYLQVVRAYAVFEGRAHREEFWMFTLVNLGVSLGLGVCDAVAGWSNILGAYGLLGGLYAAAVLLPTLAVSARRLHDTGRSALWLVAALVPIAGFILLLVFFALPGETGPNRFGTDPLTPEAGGLSASF